jgi:SET domain
MPHLARDPEFDFDVFLDSVALCVPNVFSGAGTTRNKHGTQTGSFLFGFNTMLNHSCAPNCHEMYHEGGMIIVAAKDIAPDEQLFIDYLPRKDMPLSSRQAILRSQYGFDCRCELCKKQLLSE